MSNLPLMNLQEVAEVTIFRVILQELVDKGYTPDVTNTTLYPATTVGEAAYKAAQAAIVADKGFCVELFNMSNPDYKGMKDLPRIVLIFEDPIPGDIGLDQATSYIDDGPEPLMPIKRPPEIFDIPFSVHLISRDTTQRRLLVGILGNAIATKGYIPIIPRFEHRGFNIFVHHVSNSTLPSAIDGLMERVYRFMIKDLLLIEYLQVFPEVATLQEILVQQEIQERLITLQVGSIPPYVPPTPPIINN